MEIKFARSYRAKTGTVMYVYLVTSISPSQLELIKIAQGDYYWEDETTHQPVWQTSRYIGERGTLILTAKGKLIADMSAFDKAASLASQYGGNLGQAIADRSMDTLLSNVFRSNNTVDVTPPEPKQIQPPIGNEPPVVEEQNPDLEQF